MRPCAEVAQTGESRLLRGRHAHTRTTYKWLNKPWCYRFRDVRRLFACFQGGPVGVRRPVAGVYGARTSSSTTPRSGHSSRARSAPVDRGQFILRRARYPYWGGLASILSQHAGARRRRGLHAPRSRRQSGHQGARSRTPTCTSRSCIVSLAKTALTGGHHFFLTLHFPRAYIPSGWAVIAPTRSTWGTRASPSSTSSPRCRRARRSSRRAAPSSSASTRSSSATSASAWASRGSTASRPGGPSSTASTPRRGLKYDVRSRLANARRAVLLLPPLRHQVARRGAAARRVSVPARGADRRRVRRARRRAPGAALRRQPDARSAPTCAPTARSSTPTPSIPASRLHLDVDHGRGPLALLPAPLSTWLSGNPRARIDINGPFTHPVIDGEVHDIDANLEGIKLTDGSAKLHFEEGKLALHPAGGKVARGQASADIDLDLAPGTTAGPPSWRSRASIRARSRSCRAPPRPSSPAASTARCTSPATWCASRERIELTRLTAELARNKPGGRLPRTLKLAGNGEYTPARHHAARRDRVGRRRHRRRRRHHRRRDSGRIDAGRARRRRRPPRRCSRAGARPPACASTRCTPSGASRARSCARRCRCTRVASNVSYARRTLDKLEADLSLRAGSLVLSRSARQRPRRHHRRRGRARPLRRRARSPEGDADGARAADRARPLGRRRSPAGSASTAPPTSTSISKARSPIRTAARRSTLPRLEIQGDVYTGGALRLALRRRRRHRAGAVAASRARRLGQRRRAHRLGRRDGPARLLPRDFPLVAIPWVKTVPVALAGTLSGDMHIGGTIDHPVPGGILSLVAFKVREVLLGKGDLKMDPGSDAIHLSGKFFDNLVTVDGWLTLVPKVSVAATIKVQEPAAREARARAAIGRRDPRPRHGRGVVHHRLRVRLHLRQARPAAADADAHVHRRERPPAAAHRQEPGRGAGDLRRAHAQHQAGQPLLAHRRVHHARHRRQDEQRLHEGRHQPRAPRVLLPRPVRAHPRPGHASS